MPVDRRYRDAVRDKYNGIDDVWASADDWHQRIHKEIIHGVLRLSELAPGPHETLIDIGSGGTNYDVRHGRYVHLDIARDRLSPRHLAVCGDAQALPFRTGSADCLLCVGPVVNYCALIEVVAELARVAKPSAWLLFHVELSNSLEHLLKPAFRARAYLATTFYRGEEKTWVYSTKAVLGALDNAGFDVIEVKYFHIFSALVYRMHGNANRAARWASLDKWLAGLPGIGAIADSALIICRRRPS